MNFIPHTREELQELGIKENNTYTILYQNKDYFNGKTTVEQTKAVAVFNKSKILFMVTNLDGTYKFVNNVRIVGSI